MIPGTGDIIGGIIQAFLDIFLNPGQASIRNALKLLFVTSAGPNLTAVWIVELYALMWGLGVLISIASSAIRALWASWSGNTHKFLTSWLILVKSYLFGWFVPIVFAAGFALSSAITISLAAMVEQAPEKLDLFTKLDTAVNGINFVMAPVALLLGVTLEIVIWVAVIGLPIFVFILSPLMFSFSGGEKGSKIYTTLTALVITSMTAAPAMVTWLLIALKVVSKLSVDQTATGTIVPFVNVFVLGVTIAVPWLIYKQAHQRVERVIATGAMTINNQVSAAQRAERSSGSSSKIRNTVQSASNIIGFAVAGAAGAAASSFAGQVLSHAEKTGNIPEDGKSPQSPSKAADRIAKVAKAAQVASNRRAANPNTGPAGAAVFSAVSIAGSRLATRQHNKVVEKLAPESPPATPPSESP
jgi:MFS family permease